MRPFLAIILAIGVSATPADADPTRDQVLAIYHQAVQRFGIDKDDPSAAFVTFLTGCYVGYFAAELPPDDQFVALMKALKPTADNMFAKMSPQDRRTALDYFIVTGTLMIAQRTTLASNPDPTKAAALKEQAAQTLRAANFEPDALAKIFGALTGQNRSTPTAPSPQTSRTPTPAAPRRNPFEVDRGRGIGTAQIVAIVHSWQPRGTQARVDTSYVLFKDGSAHEVPDIAFDSFDAAASRAANPKEWGRWQRRGNGYVLQMYGDQKFEPPPHAEVYRPGKPDETFNGAFTKYVVGFNSHSKSTIKLDANRRFERRWSGGSYSPGVSGDYGTPSVGTVYDQDGSVTSISGNNVGGGSSRRVNGNAHRIGNYKIDGYTIELRFDDGHIERLPFYVDGARKEVGVGSDTFWLEKD